MSLPASASSPTREIGLQCTPPSSVAKIEFVSESLSLSVLDELIGRVFMRDLQPTAGVYGFGAEGLEGWNVFFCVVLLRGLEGRLVVLCMYV